MFTLIYCFLRILISLRLDKPQYKQTKFISFKTDEKSSSIEGLIKFGFQMTRRINLILDTNVLTHLCMPTPKFGLGAHKGNRAIKRYQNTRNDKQIKFVCTVTVYKQCYTLPNVNKASKVSDYF